MPHAPVKKANVESLSAEVLCHWPLDYKIERFSSFALQDAELKASPIWVPFEILLRIFGYWHHYCKWSYKSIPNKRDLIRHVEILFNYFGIGCYLDLSTWKKPRYVHRAAVTEVGIRITLPVQSVPITTEVVSLNPVHGEVYSIQHYVIKIVSDLRQVGRFLRFPPPIKLTATIKLKYCWKWR